MEVTEVTEFKQKGMKLGRQTGSFFNGMMSSNKSMPEVGKGATVLLWTDRHAYQVMEVSKDFKRVVVQQCKPKRIDNYGMGDCQIYDYSELNGLNQVIVFRHGSWKFQNDVVTFTKEFNELFDKMSREEQRKELDKLENGYGDWKLVEGKTHAKKEYSKVNILWGVQDKYYDFSF